MGHDNSELEAAGDEAAVDDATEDYWAGSGAGPEEEETHRNESREALTHEASDHDAVSKNYFPF